MVILTNILAHIKMQVENTQMLEGDFRLHQLMQLHINFYNLVLT